MTKMAAAHLEACSYCLPGMRTGLPGNSCENCMNTGLAEPAAEVRAARIMTQGHLDALNEAACRAEMGAGFSSGAHTRSEFMRKARLLAEVAAHLAAQIEGADDE